MNELIDGADELGKFDMVYAAGPYDYLNRWLATRLTAALFRTVREGGEELDSSRSPTPERVEVHGAFRLLERRS